MSAPPVFAVTFATVKNHHFPQWGAFTANSNPSATTVTEKILECAGELEGKLALENITATAIIDTTSAAYLWCQKTLKLMAAIEILTIATQQAPPLSSKWQEWLDLRWKELNEKGYLLLGGGVSAPTSPANGPTTHLDVYGIDVGDIAYDASTSIPRLRRDDDL